MKQRIYQINGVLFSAGYNKKMIEKFWNDLINECQSNQLKLEL